MIGVLLLFIIYLFIYFLRRSMGLSLQYCDWVNVRVCTLCGGMLLQD